MENAEDREGYSLVSGFSLGLVLLGMGNNNLPGLDDLKLTKRYFGKNICKDISIFIYMSLCFIPYFK